MSPFDAHQVLLQDLPRGRPPSLVMAFSPQGPKTYYKVVSRLEV